jgi:hypothetical protein
MKSPITTLVWMVLLTVEAGFLHAQGTGNPSTTNPQALPPGPWPPRAPVVSTWSVQTTLISRQQTNASAANQSSKAQPPAPVGALGVVKYMPIVHEVQIDAKGKKWDKWYEDGREVVTVDNSPPMLFTAAAANPQFFHDYSKYDFNNLEWVDPKYYMGVASLQGVPCYYFAAKKTVHRSGQSKIVTTDVSDEASRPAVPPPPPPGPGEKPLPPEAYFTTYILQAYFEKETRLPVRVSDGIYQYDYQFGRPPQGRLTLPQNINDFLKQQPK